jgi:hypothetical protein
MHDGLVTEGGTGGPPPRRASLDGDDAPGVPRRRPRSFWNTAPGAEPEDEALLEEWHKTHPVNPWKGQDGTGGFVGWANRLDERAAQRGYLMSPRSEVIPVARREVYREVLVMLGDWRFLALLAVGIVGVVISPLLGSVLVAVLCTAAAKRVRARTRGRMRAELHRRQHPDADRVRSVAFDLTKISTAARAVVTELLAAALSSTELTDHDIETNVGCTRTDLAEAAALWADSNVMSLAAADHVWMVVSNASTLESWRRMVPRTPASDLIHAAYNELEAPIHGRAIAESNSP